MRRWMLVLLSLAFHKSYAANEVPPCTPKTPVLTLAKTCYSGDMGDIQSSGKFYEAEISSGNGVNYCYNTLTFLSREGGRTKIEVLHENKYGQYRNSVYNFDSKAVYAAEKNVVVLDGLEAKCFAFKPENDHCGGGLFGGSGDIPLALTLGVGGDGYKLEGTTTNRDLISHASSKAPKVTGDFNEEKTAIRLLNDLKLRLMTKSQALLKPDPKAPKPQVNGYRACMALFNGWINDTQVKKQQSGKGYSLPDPFTPSELAVLGKVSAQYNFANSPVVLPDGTTLPAAAR